MTSPFAAIDATFNRPRDAAAILFLIEDSSYMAPLWQRLKDAYIPHLFNAITLANPSAAVSQFVPTLPLPLIVFPQAEALWMTASQHSPFKPQSDPSTRRTPRWDDIPFINFSTQGGNTISPNNVSRAIEVRQVPSCRSPFDT